MPTLPQWRLSLSPPEEQSNEARVHRFGRAPAANPTEKRSDRRYGEPESIIRERVPLSVPYAPAPPMGVVADGAFAAASASRTPSARAMISRVLSMTSGFTEMEVIPQATSFCVSSG